MTLDEIERHILACRACPLARNPVPGDGPAPADVMIVGQAPGKIEDRRRVPFIGPAGRVLRETLVSLGYPIDEWYFTNAVKCFPGSAAGGDKVPPASAVETCFSTHLTAELEVVQPKLIVAVGAFPAKVFGITGGVNKNAGRVFDTPWGRVLSALHPAGIMRRPKDMGKFRTQFLRIKTELAEPVVVPPTKGISGGLGEVVGVDVETQDDLLWCVGYANHTGKYADRLPGDLSKVVPCMHNAGYDISFLEAEGA
ncbi:hypothetical protein LCGC14_0458000 [marine sediment metagenome]|uniref:Uracil-DNA glycosylase-like domain-containing protein n=1 Tax=marine sediment metagenome TaxID=412755 RepID=A0A0F9SYV6_9ZZZZ